MWLLLTVSLHWRKPIYFSFSSSNQMQMISWKDLGICAQFLFPMLRICLAWIHTLMVCVYSYVHPYCVWKMPSPRSFIPSLALIYSTSDSSFKKITEPCGQKVINTFYLGLSALNSLTFCTFLLLVSMLIIISYKKKFLWWRLSNAVIYRYRSICHEELYWYVH